MPILLSLTADANVESAEQHLPRGHFIDERIQPIDQQQLIIRRVTT